MKENKKCKIVQDLLPNYIEKLTTEETNEYIKEHLDNCEECKNLLSDMEDSFVLKAENIEKEEVNYFRKLKNKMNILKFTLIFILVLIIIMISRNIIIINSLTSKFEQNQNKQNYYSKVSIYEGETLTLIESYNKDGKSLLTLDRIGKTTSDKIIEYKDINKTNVYIDSNKDKIAMLNVESHVIIPISSYNYLHTDSFWQLITNAIFVNIKSIKYNGKDTYKIYNFKSPGILYSDTNLGAYIDKETGLPIRVDSGTTESNNSIYHTIMDYNYKFNVVEDKDIIEPDLSQYKVVQE